MMLTASDNFFEDFEVGALYQHARGKTVTEADGVLLCNLVMNTAQGHFNEHLMAHSPFGSTIVFGGITASMVIGLAMQDTGENAIEEVGLDKIRFPHPVRHGDTLYAFTEVLEKDEGAGIVRFRHWGTNQEGTVVFEGERRARISRRP